MGPDTEAFKVFTAMGMNDQKEVAALLEAGRTAAYTRQSDYHVDAGGAVVSRSTVQAGKEDRLSEFSDFKAGIHLGHFSIDYGAQVEDDRHQPLLKAQVTMTKSFIGSNSDFHIVVQDKDGQIQKIVDGSCSSKTGECHETVKDAGNNVLMKVDSTSDMPQHPEHFKVDSTYTNAAGNAIGISHQDLNYNPRSHDLSVRTELLGGDPKTFMSISESLGIQLRPQSKKVP